MLCWEVPGRLHKKTNVRKAPAAAAAPVIAEAAAAAVIAAAAAAAAAVIAEAAAAASFDCGRLAESARARRKEGWKRRWRVKATGAGITRRVKAGAAGLEASKGVSDRAGILRRVNAVTTGPE